MRFLTAGESHGPALVGIIEGLPSGLPVSSETIEQELARRRKGYGRGDRQKIETDKVELLSGVRFGKTLGSPVALLIRNCDWENWKDIMSVESVSDDINRQRDEKTKGKIEGESEGVITEESARISKDTLKEKLRTVEVPRPGHADYVGGVKYSHKDMRNVLERASARETAMRVAIGAIAKIFLRELDIQIFSRVTEIGGISAESLPSTWWWEESVLSQIEQSLVRVADKNSEMRICEKIKKAQETGDTLGGQFEVVATGAPIGLGSYSQWDRRLEGLLGQHFMSLNAIKAFTVGMGDVSREVGSRAHDEMMPGEKLITYSSNRSGGITGGMTTGQPLVVRADMKPLSTLKRPLNSVSVQTGHAEKSHYERSDVCAVPSAAVIGESLMALALSEAILEKFGGDSLEETQSRVRAWKAQAEERFWNL